jgi:hypothetical protein
VQAVVADAPRSIDAQVLVTDTAPVTSTSSLAVTTTANAGSAAPLPKDTPSLPSAALGSPQATSGDKPAGALMVTTPAAAAPVAVINHAAPASAAAASRGNPLGAGMSSAAPARPAAPAVGGGLGSKVGGFLRKFFVGGASPAPTDAASTRYTLPDTSAAVSPPAAAAGPRTIDPKDATLAAIVTAAQEEVQAASRPATAAPVAQATPPSPAAAASGSSDAGAAKAATQPRKNAVSPGGAVAVFPDEALLCGNREEMPATRWSSEAGLRYELADHLVGALREAWQVGSKWRVPTHFELPQGRVVVDTAQGRVYFSFDTSKLSAMWSEPLARRPKTRTLNRQENREFEALLAQPGSMLRMDQLLWRGGMLTSAGRLPSGVDVTRTIYLKHWPNFTRIDRFPQAVRVAALWATRGASIIETAKLVGVPQRQVIAFYNGMAALDLVTEDGSHIRRSQRKGQNRGLLTRLLGWLQH